MATPVPLSISPSSFWSGVDGNWSTFVLQVGTPPTALDVFVSTSETINYLNDAQACNGNQTCISSRGGNFNTSASSTYNQIGWYNLNLESNLNYENNPNTNRGQYGYDVVSLGYQGSGGPSLGNQIVANMVNDDFWLGYFGILPKPFNFTNYENPYPSYLETLRSKNQIPSLSWAYTAGAKYRLNGVFGSLTLGGYDAERFVPNSLSIPMSSDNARYLSLGVQSIGLSVGSTPTSNALSKPITMVIDSTLPYIWLPPDACQAFQRAFSLDFNNSTGLYTVSNDTHQNLVGQNPQPSVTFTIGASTNGGQTVDIKLPYSAFDLKASPPLTPNATLFFPIRQGNDSSQYVLGRTFLQEAYVIADFERQNFSVSQVQFEVGQRAQLVPIQAQGNISITRQPPSSGGGGGSNAGAIAGGVVGGVVAIALIILAIIFYRRRSKKRHLNEKDTMDHEGPAPPYTRHDPSVPELSDSGKFRTELDAVESGRATPTQQYEYYAGSPPLKAKVAPGSPRSPLAASAAELDATQYHELEGTQGQGKGKGISTGAVSRPKSQVVENPKHTEPAEVDGEIAEATPVHVRSVSREELSQVKANQRHSAEGMERGRPVPERQISDVVLPGAFVGARGRSVGSKRSGALSSDSASLTSRDLSPLQPSSPDPGHRSHGRSPTFSEDFDKSAELESTVSPLQSPQQRPVDKF